MRCESCGSESARILRVNRTSGSGDDLLVIENVPMVSCPACGESYLTAATLHGLENLKAHAGDLARSRPVGVVSFDTA